MGVNGQESRLLSVFPEWIRQKGTNHGISLPSYLLYLPPPREDPQQPTICTQDGEEIRMKRDKRKNKMTPVC